MRAGAGCTARNGTFRYSFLEGNCSLIEMALESSRAAVQLGSDECR
jgi:hypothetical protein